MRRGIDWMNPSVSIPLIPYDCQLPDSRHPEPVLVKLYASAGLHRYNMLEGTNFKLVDVIKFNKLLNFLSPYYITLLAQDSVSGSHQTFQVKESELQNNDWIYLYLELVLCAIERVRISDGDLSKLKIVKAVVETKEDMLTPNERLNAKNAVVYITFKGLVNTRIGAGEHDERKAIIRRILNEHTGYLSLIGDLIGENEFVNIDPATFFKSPACLEALDRGQELLPRSPWM